MRLRAKVDQRGRVTIPKDVRKRLQLEPGDEIEFEPATKTFRIRKNEMAAQGEKQTATTPDWEQLGRKLSRVFGPMGVGDEQISSVLTRLRGLDRERQEDSPDD